MGGLLGPVTLRWFGFHERAMIRTLFATVTSIGPLLERAVGEILPPDRRGSEPSSVYNTWLPAFWAGEMVKLKPVGTRPPRKLKNGRDRKLVSVYCSRLEYQVP